MYDKPPSGGGFWSAAPVREGPGTAVRWARPRRRFAGKICPTPPRATGPWDSGCRPGRKSDRFLDLSIGYHAYPRQSSPELELFVKNV